MQADFAHQRSREAQRTKILDGALKAFARLGEKTTMADVAAAAGVSQGLAYRYFSSKEQIMRELVEQATRASPADLHSFLDMPGTPGERLTMLVTVLVESRRQQPEFYRLLDQVQNAQTLPDDLRELLDDRRGQTFLEVVRRLIREGQATGEVATDDPDQLVLALVACLEGLTRLAVRDVEHFKEHGPAARILLRMLLKPGPDQE